MAKLEAILLGVPQLENNKSMAGSTAIFRLEIRKGADCSDPFVLFMRSSKNLADLLDDRRQLELILA
jgi:hypothetical protein